MGSTFRNVVRSGEFFLSPVIIVFFFLIRLFEVADLQFCICSEVTVKAEEVLALGVGSRG